MHNNVPQLKLQAPLFHKHAAIQAFGANKRIIPHTAVHHIFLPACKIALIVKLYYIAMFHSQAKFLGPLVYTVATKYYNNQSAFLSAFLDQNLPLSNVLANTPVGMSAG